MLEQHKGGHNDSNESLARPQWEGVKKKKSYRGGGKVRLAPIPDPSEPCPAY